jgi:MFS family permease
VGRASARSEKLTPAQTLAVPLSQSQKMKLNLLLEKAITEGEKTSLKSKGGFLQQIGAFFGISCFTLLAAHFGRRVSFFIALILAWATLILTFSTFHEPSQIWYLWPILGFGTLAPFGGYAIYFPELFPTRLRTTGTSFCYNVGRYITAFGLLILGPLAKQLDGWAGLPGFRVAAMVLASSYLVGIIALIWAPETVNHPLPEDGTIGH